eukprot:TRINITY_DN15713_c0_g1_i1.p1 TRINITY_DN15713_c0_g1~~TRINITY_DN15713_c0_g1_i1.p1  ORF type:complete len:714 (+),score=105.13 TRINITY_DN15713_c0_g1_i1:80-2221(+)
MSRGGGTRSVSQRQSANRGAERRVKRREMVSKQQGSPDVPRDPTESELMFAVESLYHDELRPYGRILRKRLVEMAEQHGLEAPHADLIRLRSQCSACSWLQIESEDSVEWSATIIGRPANFVDIYDPADNYSEAFWAEAATFFEKSNFDGMNYPGGRYVCAQGLTSLGCPVLRGFSLGRICHFVQLAMTTRKILGYCNGAIVPYARSETMVKERCAEQQKVCKSAKVPPLTSWNVFRACLRELLDRQPEGVPVSNIKRLFKSQFQVDLSETVFGHATVCELFRDARLKGICSIQFLGNGYMVFPAVPEVIDCSAVDEVHKADDSENHDVQAIGKTRQLRFGAMNQSEQELPPQAVSELCRPQVPGAAVSFAKSASLSAFASSAEPLRPPKDPSVLDLSSLDVFARNEGRAREATDATWHLTLQALGLPGSSESACQAVRQKCGTGGKVSLGLQNQLYWAEGVERRQVATTTIDRDKGLVDDGLVKRPVGNAICINQCASGSLPPTPPALFAPTPSPLLCEDSSDFTYFSWGSSIDVAACSPLGTFGSRDMINNSTDAGYLGDSSTASSTPLSAVEHTSSSFNFGPLGWQNQPPCSGDNLVEEQFTDAVDVKTYEAGSLPPTPVTSVPPTPSPVLCNNAFEFSYFSWGSSIDQGSAACSPFGTFGSNDVVAPSTDAGSSGGSWSGPSTPRLIADRSQFSATTKRQGLAQSRSSF